MLRERTMANWRAMILEKADGEEVLECTLSPEGMSKEFDAGYGGTEGLPFTAWSATRVFFPVQYDGSEWVGAVPRNPTPRALKSPCEHEGGG